MPACGPNSPSRVQQRDPPPDNTRSRYWRAHTRIGRSQGGACRRCLEGLGGEPARRPRGFCGRLQRRGSHGPIKFPLDPATTGGSRTWTGASGAASCAPASTASRRITRMLLEPAPRSPLSDAPDRRGGERARSFHQSAMPPLASARPDASSPLVGRDGAGLSRTPEFLDAAKPR